MSEYIYIASDSKLSAGSVGDNGVTFFNTTFYPSEDAMQSFFFEENYDPVEKISFNFSKHFSDKKYQVASISLNLPEENTKHLKPKNKKALQELFAYIKRHFKDTNATYVEILFSLNSFEDQPIRQKHAIDYVELSIEHLYYDNHKFLTISRC